MMDKPMNFSKLSIAQIVIGLFTMAAGFSILKTMPKFQSVITGFSMLMIGYILFLAGVFPND